MREGERPEAETGPPLIPRAEGLRGSPFPIVAITNDHPADLGGPVSSWLM